MAHRLRTRSLGCLTLVFVASALLTGCPQWQRGEVAYPAPKDQFVTVKGRKVHVVDQGDRSRPVILFVHGFASSWVVWARLMKELRGRYRVIALDLPGFGWSDKRQGDYSPQGLADVVDAVLQARGVDRAHVVAHSWGCSIALALAHRHPKRVRSLTLMGAWIYDEQIVPFLRWARVKGLGEFLFAAFYKERVGDRMALAFYHPERYVSYGVVRKVKAALERPGAVRAALAATRQQYLKRQERHYRTVEQPTLLLWGREDEVALRKYGERLAREMPNARLQVFARCGHFPMIEAYGGTRAALRAHLRRVEEREAARTAPAPAPPARPVAPPRPTAREAAP